MREAPRGVTPGPSRVQTAGRALRSGFGRHLRVMRSPWSFGTGSVRYRRDAPVRRTRPSDTTVLGRNRGPGSGGEPQESCRGSRGRRHPDRSTRPWSAGCPLSRREGTESAGGKDPGSRVDGGRDRLWRGERKPRRVSAPDGFGRHGVRISAGSKTLKLRGIVIFWSSEQQNAMSRTARRDLASKDVRLRGGETL
jgi:hypothetical protein